MNRRGFLRGILGLAATAALPEKALALLARTSTATDAEFLGAIKLDFTSADLTMSIEDFSARFIQPAMIALSQSIDRDVLDSLK